MSNELWGTVIVAASLSRFVALGEWHAREYLTTLSDTDANSLWKCLRRLGWWFPDDEQSPQERLVWWLFRDDVTRLDFSDGTERRRIETSEERLAEAVRHLESLASATTIPSSSCLRVAGFVRAALRHLERNELPLGHQFLQCGSPDDFRFDVCRIRFDGECLNDAMNAVAIQLDLRPGRLDWQDATGHPFTTERRAFDDVRRLLTGWRDELEREIQARGELPPGWEATDSTWPDCPIKTVEHLREWLSSWLRGIHQARSSSRSNPENYLDDVQRELRNTRRATRAWFISLPTKFNDEPANIHKAERQLELLIDGLAPPGGDTKPEGDSEPPKPVEHKSRSHLAGVQFPSESRLAWPEYPYRAEQFMVMHKAQRCPTDRDDFSWLGTFWNGESTSLNRLCGEPNAGSIVSYESSAKPQMFYVFTDDEVSVLRESFPQCSYVDDLRLPDVEAYLLSNDCEPNGRSAKSLVGLLAGILNKRKTALAVIQETEATSKPPKPVERQAETLARGEGADGKQSKPKGTGHRRTSEELFKAALRTHHKYETGGSVLNVEPASTRQIESLTNNSVSDSTAGRLLTKHFGSVEKYRDACFSGAIGPKLVVLLGDGLHAFGSFDATERDVEDQNDNDSDE